MDTLFEIDDRDVLHGWAEVRGRRRRSAQRQSRTAVTGLRFAFYGRTSTAEFQDPVTSRAWQREMAESVISGHGVITSEFFEVGVHVGCRGCGGRGRRRFWSRRKGRTAGSMRWWSVSSSGRSPTASSMRSTALLAMHGVAVWLPEAGGPVDLADPTHCLLMQVLGAQSQREVVRSRHRTLAAMTAQTVEQGRFLGGRPPDGYRLVDAGPHPNRAHAAWGRRRQRLDLDPVTARHVRWIFAERLAGRIVAGIARELN